MSEPLATLKASPPRRVIAVGMLVVLGFVLLYLAVTSRPAELVYTFFMLIVGAGALWVARLMWASTAVVLHLTNEGVFDTAGRTVCLMENVASVDRGMFAFKPSNGFLIRLHDTAEKAWAPGLWWRVGKRVGVGGVTAASQGKAMADLMTAMLVERDGAKR